MMRVVDRSRTLWSGRPKSLPLLAALLVVGALTFAAQTWATPPSGVVLNQILAFGLAPDAISQHMQVHRNVDGTKVPWQLQLQVQGDTDYYSQHLVLAPGGYSGWHSHPGLLIGAVKSGQIDFYNANCEKVSIGPDQVFSEDDKVHAIINTGGVDADLYISYFVKHGQPRRREEAAPPCAIDTPIP
jgi:quercetin dioxygenase-like cupin family protein